MTQYTTLIESINSAGEGLKKVLQYNEGVIVVNLTERKLCILDNVIKFDNILDITVSAETKTDPRIELTNALANAFAASKSGTKTSTDTSSVIRRSIVGGVVAGAPGAIIGGLTADKKTEEYHRVDSSYQDYTIIISLNDLINPNLSIHVGSSKTETDEIVNTFRAIVASNKAENRAKNEIDKKQYVAQLYKNGRKYREELRLTNDGFIMHIDNAQKVYEIYLQLLANDVNSEEVKFYYFFFETYIHSRSKYSYKYKQLYTDYISKLKDYLLWLKNKESIKDELNSIYNETLIYAHMLSGGFIDEVEFGYMLLLAVGDLINETFGDSVISVKLWEEGVLVHHMDVNKKNNVSAYIDKIKDKNQNYIEPKEKKVGIFDNLDSDTALGCLAVLVIIAVIIYFIIK